MLTMIPINKTFKDNKKFGKPINFIKIYKIENENVILLQYRTYCLLNYIFIL